VAPVSAALRDRFDLQPDAKGLVIIDVAANGQAAEKGFRPGDLLISADNDPVKSGADVLNHLEAARKANRRNILLQVQSGGEVNYIPLKVDPKK
jgi:serine protease Do